MSVPKVFLLNLRSSLRVNRAFVKISRWFARTRRLESGGGRMGKSSRTAMALGLLTTTTSSIQARS